MATADDPASNVPAAFACAQVLVDDLPSIRRNYLRSMFVVDLLTTIPFENVVLAAVALEDSEGATARYIGLLRLLKLVGGALCSWWWWWWWCGVVWVWVMEGGRWRGGRAAQAWR